MHERTPRPVDGVNRRAPSYPSRRSRRIRDAIFILSAVAGGGAMYTISREQEAPIVVAEGDELKGVFSKAFEPYLRLKVTVVGAGIVLEGRGERITKTLYEGRKQIVESGRATGKVLGQSVSVEFESTQRWDAGTGLVTCRTRALVQVPGFPKIDFDLTSSREGAFLVTRGSVLGKELERPIVKQYPQEVDLVPGLLEPARVKPLRVGSRWTELGIEAGLTGEVRIVQGEVEVVERLELETAGRSVPAFRAVARMQTDTGRPREFSRWYDLSGRCLKQEAPLSVLKMVVEREDLPLEVEPRTSAD